MKQFILIVLLLLCSVQAIAKPSHHRRHPTYHGYHQYGGAGRGYINSDGEHVHSPTKNNVVAADVKYRCKDGSFSYSRHRRGACGHHGGIAR